MGGCESVQEEEVYEPRRRRPRTPIVYARAPRVVPVTTMRHPIMVPTVMSMPERRFPLARVEQPSYVYDDYYDDEYFDRGRGRYHIHSY
ncbi:hypothetical protein ACF0H5_007319 [Mactra antiquata]